QPVAWVHRPASADRWPVLACHQWVTSAGPLDRPACRRLLRPALRCPWAARCQAHHRRNRQAAGQTRVWISKSVAAQLSIAGVVPAMDTLLGWQCPIFPLNSTSAYSARAPLELGAWPVNSGIHRIKHPFFPVRRLGAQLDQLFDLAMGEDIELVIFHGLEGYFGDIGSRDAAVLNGIFQRGSTLEREDRKSVV